MINSASTRIFALILRLSALFAVTLTGHAQQNWRWANSLPASVQWKGAAFGNGLYVVVGNDATIASSPDGVTWTIRRMSTQGPVLNGVAFANGQFVAVGMGSPTRTGAALIMTSPDGINWSIVESVANTFSAQLMDVTHGGGTWVVVSGGATRVLTSPDGITWTARSTPFASPSKVAYGAGRFVANGGNNTALTSTDGITWTSSTVSANNRDFISGVAFGAGKFVVVGRDSNFVATAYTSPDGTTWTAASAIPNGSNSTGFLAAASDGTRFVAAGGVGVYTSPDGNTWTKRTDALPSSARQLGPQAENISTAAFANGQFFVLGIYGSITTSTDGVAWTRRSTGTVNDLGAVLHDGTRFVASGSGGTILTSTDGSAWNQLTTGSTADFQYLAYNGSRYVTAGFSGIYHSTNLTAWTAVAGTTFDRWGSAAFGGGRFVVAHSATTLGVRTSTDGVTWSALVGIAGAGGNTDALVYGNNLFVLTMIGFGPTPAKIYTSPDGTAWTQRAADLLAAGTSVSSIAFGGGRFVGLTGNQRSLTSTDGVSWTSHALTTVPSLSGIRYVSGQFFADAATYGSPAYSSSDGVSWTLVDNSTGPNTRRSVLAAANGVIVAAGFSGSILVAEPPASPLAPKVAAAPASQTISAGSTAVFSVAATGQGLSYQWRFNGTAIAGATGASYVIRNATAANSGNYANVITNSFGTTTTTAAVLTISTNPNFGRISNLSILTDITAADPQFTVGTVIGGALTTGPKPLLVRAAGPSLSALGVGNPLADPKLEIFSGQTVVAGNDNWSGDAALSAAFSSVGAFAYLNAASRDAAVFNPATAAGGYTVQVSGVGGATGPVIAELYDATPASSFPPATPRLVNVSVLKTIPTGSLLTAGFVIGGSTAKTVLVRVIGPRLALAPFGLTDAMADPKLELFSGQTVIAANDNWGGDAQLSAVGASVGAFAVTDPTSKDAMLVITLAPGNYTVQATHSATTSGGLAIVEVYEVP